MRAGRLIEMISALQQQGRMTAGELAAQLEVSVRTVLRDVETLSSAGVPIYTAQGAGGGIDLMDGFHTSLAGFTTADSRSAPARPPAAAKPSTSLPARSTPG